jgi:hypothetical protein
MLDLKDIITLSVGSLGALLGIINTKVLLNTRRVRLKVIPSSVIVGPRAAWSSVNEVMNGGALAIEVVNLSAFPVTVTEVGLKLPGGHRALICQPPTADSKPMPRRLEPRESFTAYKLDLSDLRKKIGRAYATTACNETRFGTSKALRALGKLQ